MFLTTGRARRSRPELLFAVNLKKKQQNLENTKITRFCTRHLSHEKVLEQHFSVGHGPLVHPNKRY